MAAPSRSVIRWEPAALDWTPLRCCSCNERAGATRCAPCVSAWDRASLRSWSGCSEGQGLGVRDQGLGGFRLRLSCEYWFLAPNPSPLIPSRSLRIRDFVVRHRLHHVVRNAVGSEAHLSASVDEERRSAADVELLGQLHRLPHPLLSLGFGRAGCHFVGIAARIFHVAFQHLLHILIVHFRLMIVNNSDELPCDIIVI